MLSGPNAIARSVCLQNATWSTQLQSTARPVSAGLDLKISKLISMQLVCCSLTDTTEHIRHLMNENHMRHLPVIDNHSLIGVISISDITG